MKESIKACISPACTITTESLETSEFILLPAQCPAQVARCSSIAQSTPWVLRQMCVREILSRRQSSLNSLHIRKLSSFLRGVAHHPTKQPSQKCAVSGLLVSNDVPGDVHRTATISTISSDKELAGFPNAGVIEYVADDEGQPVMILSSLSAHMRDLKKDGRASITCLSPGFQVASSTVCTMSVSLILVNLRLAYYCCCSCCTLP